MKTFKQRLSIYYNAHAGRRGEGALWHDRYKSVLVEGVAKLFVNRELKKREVLSEYRQNLYLQGAEKHNALTGEISKPGFKRNVQ